MDAAKRDQVTTVLRSGNKRLARAILVDAIRKDPADELAWLALAQLTEDSAQQKDCLRRVLALNPANKLAAHLLDKLSSQPASGMHPSAAASAVAAASNLDPALAELKPISAVPASDAPPTPTQSALTANPAHAAAVAARPARTKWLLPAIITAILAGGIVLAGVALVSYQRFVPRLPVIVPTAGAAVPTPIRFPTFPPEWTPTPARPTGTTLARPTASPTPPSGSATTRPGSAPLSHLDYPIAFTLVKGTNRTAYITDGSGPGTQIPGADRVIGWLPDGSGLIYLALAEQAGFRVFSAAVDGSEPRLQVELPRYADTPIVSPDGRQLAFVILAGTVPQRAWHLDVMNIDGSRRSTIYSISDSNSFLLAGDWSPDGRRIAFREDHCDDGPVGAAHIVCDDELYVIGADGSGLQALTTGLRGAQAPRWSPDGLQLVFDLGPWDEYAPTWTRLMLTKLDGSQPQMLVLDGYTDVNQEQPEWSPDGKLIAFTGLNAKGASIYVLPVTCFGAPKLCSWADVTRLPVQAGYVGEFAWKGSPPLIHPGAAPTIPDVTPLIPSTDNWVSIGAYAGHDTSRTAPLTLSSGTLRLSWTYTGPADSKFAVAIVRDTTQEISVIDGTYGPGSGVSTYFVLFPGNDYSFLVESLGAWNFNISFKVTQ